MAEDHHPKVASGEWFLDIGIIIGLVIFAGIMSGLTLGLMSLSLMELQVLKRSGSEKEKHQASRLLPVVSNQHRLLVTLLLCNACAMEALPIFVDKLVSPVLAILISVTLVLIFGEVLPQAACVRYGLAIGTSLIGLVRGLMILVFPITWPIAKLLDYILGSHDSGIYRRPQLKALVTMHGKEAGQGGELTFDETNIISGALDLTHKYAIDAMTPVESIFSLSVDTKLDKETMHLIMSRGHSRVPVYMYDPRNIIGVILVKNLITVQCDDDVSVGSMQISPVPRVASDMRLYQLLDEFQKGSSHMALVVKRKNAGDAPSPLGKVPPSTSDSRSSPANQPDRKENTAAANSERSSPTHVIVVDSVQHDDPSNNAQQAAKDRKECIGGTHPMDPQGHARSPEREGRGLGKRKPSRHNLVVQLENILHATYHDEEALGIITLEDVIEELLQEEIVDETDVYVDVHNKIRVPGQMGAAGLVRKASFRRLLGSPDRSRHGKKGVVKETEKREEGV